MTDYPYRVNIESVTLKNGAYRKVLHTTKQSQLVVMSIPVKQDIHMERHESTTQFIRVEKGRAVAYINSKQYKLADGDSIVIPAGSWHYIRNSGDEPLKLYTIYCPPEHPDGLIQRFRPDD
jgi:mannose-6-phosphate isomerase-like protein (cupin superfamily)